MAAIRHSRIELTMNYYTAPGLLDIAGMVETLPNIGIVQRRVGRQLATSR